MLKRQVSAKELVIYPLYIKYLNEGEAIMQHSLAEHLGLKLAMKELEEMNENDEKYYAKFVSLYSYLRSIFLKYILITFHN